MTNSRPSQTESAYIQTFVSSCSDVRAFTRLSRVHVQTFARSCPDFRAFTRLSCVHVQIFIRFLMLPDYVILNARRPLIFVHLRSGHICFHLGWKQVCPECCIFYYTTFFEIGSVNSLATKRQIFRTRIEVVESKFKNYMWSKMLRIFDLDKQIDNEVQMIQNTRVFTWINTLTPFMSFQ